MAFGPNSTNPRERRAYAHAKLSQLKRGEADFEVVTEAVKAASHNRKGQTSGFAENLGKTAVLLVDWSATGYKRPGIIHHNFGGYVMPQSETVHWITLRNAIEDRLAALHPIDYDEPQDSVLGSLYNQHNQILGAGYPIAKFTRIFEGNPELNDHAFPTPGTVINIVEVQDVIPFTGWNEDQAVATRIAELR